MSALLSFDYLVFHFINTVCANPIMDYVCPVLRDRMTWIPLYIILTIYIFYRYKLDGLKMIFGILLCFALADSISYQILKPLFHRLRPCHNTLLHARLVLNHCGGKWSFPSSHASDHLAISLGIILFGVFSSKWLNVLVLLWAISIGFSQIYVGVHYPLDILSGFMLGILCAFASKWIMDFITEKFFNQLKKT